MIRYLYVFDFDGTLFNSPEPPTWWKDKDGWWFDIQSMTPPCLEKEPSEDWWVESTVNDFEKAAEDEEIYNVLLTGRPAKDFTNRVKELLRQKSLQFDEVHLSDREDTQAFKVEQIKRIIKEHPSIERVEMWEDFVDMIPPYRAAVKEAGLEFKLWPVKVKRRKAECEKDDEALAKKVAHRFMLSV